MMKNYKILSLLGIMPLTELTTAATISLADLAGETADQTYTAGNTILNVDGVYDTSDVTFAFTFDTGAFTNTVSGSTLFEFGNGGREGTSLTLREGVVAGKFEVIFAHGNQSTSAQIGGNGSSLIALLDPNTDNVDVVASVAFAGGNAELNLFVNGVHIGKETGVSADWSSDNDGGYDATGGGGTLAPNFSNVTWGGASLLNASFDTDLSLYSGVAVTSVPEPSSTLLCGIAGLGLLTRRNRRGC